MKQWLWLALVVIIIAALFGCGEDDRSLGKTTWITKTTLSSITVEPASATISVGHTQQFKAIGTYSDSSTDDIPKIPWTSSDPTVATIDTSGKATGVAEGVTTITAGISGVEGSSMLTVSSKP